MFVLLEAAKAAGKRCCSRATAFEKAMRRCGLSLQRIGLGQMEIIEFVGRQCGRGFRGKNQARWWGPAED